MATQFESRIQNVVYQLEVGLGARILKGTLFVLFMVIVSILYMARRHQGFREERAMDQAQLAVQYAETGHLQTKVIRPLTLPVLKEKGVFTSTQGPAPLDGLPDVVNAPFYPMVVGTAFKVFGTDFSPPVRFRFIPERWIIVPLNLLFCFLAGLFLYLTGLRLFSPRVALTGLTVFLLSGIPFSRAVQGTELSLALFLFMFTIWSVLLVIDAWSRPSAGAVSKWLPLLLGGGALALLPLTRYAAGAVIPGVLFLLFMGLKRKAWVPALILVAMTALLLAPWITRNLDVTGKPFGLAPSLAFSPDESDVMVRSLNPATDEEESFQFRPVLSRCIRAVNQAFTFESSPMGAGLVFCLFVATFFYRFQRRGIGALRWSVLISYVVLTLCAGLFGLEQMEVSFLFYPIVTLLGSAFFYLLLDRLQIQVNVVSLSVIALFILFQSLPLLTDMTSPKPLSYPPYHPQMMSGISDLFEEDELLVTDVPWATAWYGNQLSLQLPATVQDFFDVHDHYQSVEGLYFTLATRNRPYHMDLVRGTYAPWRNIMDGNALPRGFPFTFGQPLGTGEEIIYADRERFFPATR